MFTLMGKKTEGEEIHQVSKRELTTASRGHYSGEMERARLGRRLKKEEGNFFKKGSGAKKRSFHLLHGRWCFPMTAVLLGKEREERKP